MTELVNKLVAEKSEYLKNICHNYSCHNYSDMRDVESRIISFFEILGKMIWKIYYPICLQRLVSGCMLPGEKLAKILKDLPREADKRQYFVFNRGIYDRIKPSVNRAREYDDISKIFSSFPKNKNVNNMIKIGASHLKEEAVKIESNLRQLLEQNL